MSWYNPYTSPWGSVGQPQNFVPQMPGSQQQFRAPQAASPAPNPYMQYLEAMTKFYSQPQSPPQQPVTAPTTRRDIWMYPGSHSWNKLVKKGTPTPPQQPSQPNISGTASLGGQSWNFNNLYELI